MAEVALVVTTVQVPSALELYRDLDRDVAFYVVGDEGAPNKAIGDFCRSINASYFTAADQRKLGYACSDLLRWRDSARRSVGCLEAVRDGAEVVILADDDNLPVDRGYFARHQLALTGSFSGLVMQPAGGWADPGQLMMPPVRHRGFPQQLWNPPQPLALGHATGLRIGVNQGLVLGDPDIDAVERIARHPVCTGVSPAGEAGVALSARAYAPFNAQNTAFRAELLPVMVMQAPAGRFLDIWAAFIAERVMRDTGWSVLYGRPLVWQERNDHDLTSDVGLEMRGMRETLAFCDELDAAFVPHGADPMDAAHAVYRHLEGGRWADVAELGLAWLEDCRKVMS